MMMFSGLVWVGWFTSCGSATGIVCVTTGMVIRKMISSTSMTSTSGVVLIVATSCVVLVVAARPIAHRHAQALLRGRPFGLARSPPTSSAMQVGRRSCARGPWPTLLRRISQL